MLTPRQVLNAQVRKTCPRGNHYVFESAFKNEKGEKLPKDTRKLSLIFSEKSLRARSKFGGFGSINQVEHLLQVSQAALKVPLRKRLYYEGTNRGETLGPINVQPWTDDNVWSSSSVNIAGRVRGEGWPLVWKRFQCNRTVLCAAAGLLRVG